MRLKISHVTTYEYDKPVAYALQQIRLTPKSHPSQTVLHWRTEVTGGQRQLTFEDAHRNTVDLISFEPGTQHISVRCEGEVELRDTHGVHGPHGGYMPLWMFLRTTKLTKCGTKCAAIIKDLKDNADENNANGDLAKLHALMEAVHIALPYAKGTTVSGSTAEEALENGSGVCQDHSHVFISCAREMGLPARYVSGYLMIEGSPQQDATHAWAEAHVDGLGWVGFDAANDQSPDMRYVRVATGLDYADAAPISGMGEALGDERLSVSVEVQQQ
ncbi:MAG: transglutaminase family protein [Rhodobacteraceae bacterium]|nr:transglutaminase family protein [Paracoccaceae bacterium]